MTVGLGFVSLLMPFSWPKPVYVPKSTLQIYTKTNLNFGQCACVEVCFVNLCIFYVLLFFTVTLELFFTFSTWHCWLVDRKGWLHMFLSFMNVDLSWYCCEFLHEWWLESGSWCGCSIAILWWRESPSSHRLHWSSMWRSPRHWRLVLFDVIYASFKTTVIYTEWAKKVNCCIAGCNFVNYGPV